MRTPLLRRRIGAVIAPLMLLLAACGSSDTDSSPGTDLPPPDTVAAAATEPITDDPVAPDSAATATEDAPTVPDTTADTQAEGTEPPQPPETEVPTSEATGTGDPADGSGEGVGSEFCDIGQELDALAFDLTATPEDLRAQFDGFLILADEAIALAPDRFRPFLERNSELQRAFYDVLDRNGFDFEAASTDSDGAALTAFETLDEDFPGVEAELDAYCGLDGG